MQALFTWDKSFLISIKHFVSLLISEIFPTLEFHLDCCISLYSEWVVFFVFLSLSVTFIYYIFTWEISGRLGWHVINLLPKYNLPVLERIINCTVKKLLTMSCLSLFILGPSAWLLDKKVEEKTRMTNGNLGSMESPGRKLMH